MKRIEHYRVEPSRKVHLADYPTDDDGGLARSQGQAEFESAHRRLIDLAELLYADGRYALLVVLQGMDTSGKDSTTRAVFAGVCPTGIVAHSFQAPTRTELAQDYLWRVHLRTPARGRIAVFNRSHYEDVLIVRVRGLVPEERWRRRYDHINAFEQLLSDEGTIVVKFFLHISKDYQKQRLQKRLDNPRKHWKFDPDDLAQRAVWDDYQRAYADALRRCSTPHAPWYIIPAEQRWYRDLIVTRVLVETLEQLDLRYPPPKFDPTTIVIP